MTHNIRTPTSQNYNINKGDDDGDMKAGCLGQGALLKGHEGTETSKSKSKHH